MPVSSKGPYVGINAPLWRRIIVMCCWALAGAVQVAEARIVVVGEDDAPGTRERLGRSARRASAFLFRGLRGYAVRELAHVPKHRTYVGVTA
jgi:hypothetical protein